MLLADPAYTVPDPGPPGPYGTMAWLRATVSRFCEGDTHARRRAIVESLLADLDPEDLRAAAARMARGDAASGHTRGERNLDRALHDEGCSRAAGAASATAAAGPSAATTPSAPARAKGRAPAPAVDLPYVPVAALATALGVAPSHLADAVAATRRVAAAYHPHTDAPGADAALDQLLSVLGDGDEPEVVAARVAVLVQACEATAGLVRGDDLPVPVTRRVAPDRRTVLVDLSDHPFGAGPRRCPGETHARALVEGVLGR